MIDHDWRQDVVIAIIGDEEKEGYEDKDNDGEDDADGIVVVDHPTQLIFIWIFRVI